MAHSLRPRHRQFEAEQNPAGNPAAQTLRETAWRALDCASKKNPSAQDREIVAAWIKTATLRLEKKSTTLLDHSTFLILRNLNYDGADSGFQRSWEILAGRAWVRQSETTPKLPRKIWSKASSEDQVLYDTACFSETRETPLFGVLDRSQSLLRTAFTRVTGSAFWNRGTLFFGLAAAAFSCFSWGRELFFGAVIGMIGASFNEYLVHLGVGHSTVEGAAKFRKLGVMGVFSEEINLAHRVHHSKMLTDFRSAFSNPESRQRVDNYLQNEARKLVESRVNDGTTPSSKAESEIARIVKEIRAGGYGVDGTWAGCLSMNVLALPFFLMNWGISSFFGGPIFLITSCVFLSGFITQSLYSHRYLHMTEDDLAESKVDGTTTAFMRWFITTPVARLQVRRHYRHHHEKYDYHGTANGVIMSFSFADFVLRRGVREAEVRHLVRMRKEKFL